MTTTINADSSNGFKVTADTSSILALQTNGTTAISIDASQAVSFTNSPTVTGGTANGVAYLNGSKVLTTGSALVFDGSNLGVGVTPNAWLSLKGLQTVGGGSLTSNTNSTFIGANWYYDGANKYIANGFASRYILENGSHQWYSAPNNTSGAGAALTFTQGMTLDASGRLGIGTTSPNRKLYVQSDDSVTGGNVVGVRNSNATAGAFINFLAGGSNAPSIGAKGDDLVFNADGYNGTEWARFSSGNLLVGTTSTVAGAAFVVSKSVNDYLARFINSNSTAYGVVVNYSVASPNSTGQEFLRCVDSTADRMTVRSNGGIANYSGNNVNLSDRREKTNFAPAGDYLAKICAIPVQTFNYIDQNMEDDGGLTLGVVAQDVQVVAPELVMESDWGTEDEPKMRLSIYQTDLQYALMKCIQEQQALIQTLTARITALESA